MPTFSSLLDRKTEEVQRPPAIPVGTYTARIQKLPGETRKPEGKPFEILEFPMEILEAGDTVDPDELAEFKGDVKGKVLRHSFIFSTDDEGNFESTAARMKDFLEKHCGVEGADMRELMANSVNAQCLIEVSHRKDPNDPEVVYAQINRTMPLG